MYFRGPVGVPFFIAPFLTLLGIWRFSRPPQRGCDIDSPGLVGGRVLRVCCQLGSYGMGGPGFVGVKVRGSDASVCWLVVAVWGAAEWLTVDGSPCCEGYFEDERELMEKEQGRALPSLLELKGSVIDAIEVNGREFLLDLSAGGSTHQLRLLADSSSLPVFRGSKEPRIMQQDEDIRDAIIVSRRANLWL